MNSLLACSAFWACAISRALRRRRPPSVEKCCSDWTAAASNGSSVLRPIASRPMVSPPTASGAIRKRRYGCTTDSRPSGAPVYSAAVSSTARPCVTPASTLGMSGQRLPTSSPVGVTRGAGALQQATQHLVQVHLARDILGRFHRPAQPRCRLVGSLSGGVALFEQPGGAQGA